MIYGDDLLCGLHWHQHLQNLRACCAVHNRIEEMVLETKLIETPAGLLSTAGPLASKASNVIQNHVTMAPPERHI